MRVMRFIDWLDRRFYLVIGSLIFLISAMVFWGLADEMTTKRDYIQDNTGHRWEVRHIGKTEYIYHRGQLSVLRPCTCGKTKRDSL